MSNNNKVVVTVGKNTAKVTANPSISKVSTIQANTTSNTGHNVVKTSVGVPAATSSGVGLTGRPGINWRGPWDSSESYNAGDTTSFDGATYINILGSSANSDNPSDATSNWDLFSDRGIRGPEGLEGPKGDTGLQGFRGDKGDSIKGDKGDAFEYSGFSTAQLDDLKGDKGDAFEYDNFTSAQLANLKGDKGDAFEHDDFTPSQLENLKGEKGDKFEFSDYTPAEREELKGDTGPTGADSITAGPRGYKGDSVKGDKGDKGDAFTHGDFTAAELLDLKGDKGDKFEFEDFTTSEREELRGPAGADSITIGPRGYKGASVKGDKGDKGDAFTYEDFTPSQLAELEGAEGPGGDTGDRGPRGLQGPTGNKNRWKSGRLGPVEGYAPATGNVGDFYLETDTNKVWEFKDEDSGGAPGGAWEEIATLGSGGGSASFPGQTGQAGRVLGTDGTDVAWVEQEDPRTKLARYRDYLTQYSDKRYAAEDSDGNIPYSHITIEGLDTFQEFTTTPLGSTYSGGVYGPDLLQQIFTLDPVTEETWRILDALLWGEYNFDDGTWVFYGSIGCTLTYDEESGYIFGENEFLSYAEPNLYLDAIALALWVVSLPAAGEMEFEGDVSDELEYNEEAGELSSDDEGFTYVEPDLIYNGD